MSGLIIWHDYRDGELVNSLATEFHGTLKQLKERAQQNFEENKGAHEVGKQVIIFHNFILIEGD